MGAVYVADDERVGRRVAIKVLAGHLADNDEFVRRFAREARIAASLEHPHIVPVYDIATVEGHRLLVMRLIDGEDLAVLIAKQQITTASTVTVIGQVASALDAAHAAGLVHRDVKPANILVSNPGTRPFAYLSDFGLVREESSSGSLTATGTWMGSVDYASPEQIARGELDARSDVYSLACTAFCGLTGQPPFTGPIPARINAHLHRPRPRASALVETLPRDVDTVLVQAMAIDPADRPSSATAFADSLAGALAEIAPTTASAHSERPTVVALRATPTEAAPTVRTADPSKKAARRWQAALAIATCAAVGIAAALVLTADDGNDRPVQAPPQAAAVTTPSASQPSAQIGAPTATDDPQTSEQAPESPADRPPIDSDCPKTRSGGVVVTHSESSPRWPCNAIAGVATETVLQDGFYQPSEGVMCRWGQGGTREIEVDGQFVIPGYCADLDSEESVRFLAYREEP